MGVLFFWDFDVERTRTTHVSEIGKRRNTQKKRRNKKKKKHFSKHLVAFWFCI